MEEAVGSTGFLTDTYNLSRGVRIMNLARSLGLALLALLFVAGSATAQWGGGFQNSWLGQYGYGYGRGGYGGYGGWGGYGYGGTGGYMMGLASLTNANGQYQMQIQQARIEQQQAERERYKSRLEWDKTRIEELKLRGDEATASRQYRETVRTQQQQETLNWSKDNPPTHYIMSGLALNSIMDEIRKIQLQTNLRGPQVSIDPDVLDHINVNDGGTSGRGGFNLIKNDGKLSWPISLRTGEFNPIRQEVDQIVSQSVRMVKSDNLDGDTYTKLLAELEKLQKALDGMVSDLRPGDYILANRFVTSLNKEARVLSDPDAKKYFTGEFRAQGGTVGEVLDNMVKGGLKFAAANDGDRAAYNTFYNAMLQYDAGLFQLLGPAAAQTPPTAPANKLPNMP